MIATSALDQAGPAGALTTPVVGALRDTWEGYFGAPVPPGTTNWNAYTHQQLYDMLWHNADVGHVGSVAAEYGRHSKELADHADVLHDQRASLRANWTGHAADPAAQRLGGLGKRLSGIGDRAGTTAQATQNAGDALAVARNAMPPPPSDPTALVVGSAAAGGGAGALIGGIVGAGAGGIGAVPGAAIGAAIGAVAAGGASMFLASAAAAMQKAEAVHVMQRYEASLSHSSETLAQVGGTPAATVAAGYAGPVAGGVPWKQLVNADRLISGGSAELGGISDSRSSAMSVAQLAAEETSAGRAAGGGALPAAGARPVGEDEKHENKMPVVDPDLFQTDDLGQIVAPPVIGL